MRSYFWQEAKVKSIVFISYLLSYSCHPFLVISTIPSLSKWEAEFARLAPSINIVVYSGNKKAREMIRSLEFYEEGGCVMFKVLITSPDVILEVTMGTLDFVCMFLFCDCSTLDLSMNYLLNP